MITNIIHNENCLTGLKKLKEECIDLTVTSPPYDNLRTYNGYTFDFENIAKELYRVIKPGGVIVWIVGDETRNGTESGTSFKHALYFKKIGFNLYDTMIWDKNSFHFPAKTRYHQVFEYMFILSKGKPKTLNFLFDRKSTVTNTYGKRFNIWRYPVGKTHSSKDAIAFQHPAIFPEKLAEDHILSWSNPGDIILDPFMGSGTTAKMAILNNRRYIGYEISREYCQLAEKRLADIAIS